MSSSLRSVGSTGNKTKDVISFANSQCAILETMERKRHDLVYFKLYCKKSVPIVVTMLQIVNTYSYNK